MHPPVLPPPQPPRHDTCHQPGASSSSPSPPHATSPNPADHDSSAPITTSPIPTTPAVTMTYGPSTRIVAHPLVPSKRPLAPKLPAAQRAAMTAASRSKREALAQDLESWYEGVKDFASQLAEKYNQKPDHYLQLMFSGGAKRHKERKVNAYNAWSSAIAKEINDDAEPGEAQRLVNMQHDRIDEYHALSKEEKSKYIKQFEEERESRKFGTRLTQRGRANDMTHVCQEIEKMIYGLKNRAGVDGFFCLVRNNTEFQSKPYWYFTDERLERYLRGRIRGWDCVNIAAQAEAFCIAGCDFTTIYKTSKDKAEYLKSEIRDKIRTMLCAITGNPNAVMNYTNHEQEIVLRYGVELVGWTHSQFTNPSAISTSLPPLRSLLAALESGVCHFRRIPPTELAARQQAYDLKVMTGVVALRKQRSDAGKPRKKRKRVDAESDEEGEGDTEGADDGQGGCDGQGADVGEGHGNSRQGGSSGDGPATVQTPVVMTGSATTEAPPKKRGRPGKQPASQENEGEPRPPQKRGRARKQAAPADGQSAA
ncbi:hypothetical protein ONZ51_g12300 [Trametes cubensis]|uniref:Uncharacterized protein n=1 Tax=Trametes cubensis TaxID=1111947 RepID=A0AAD7X4Q6_9APHY|nr:hypothetical protein ONZ51_g12300 [Trametes cubensis]